MKPIVHHEVYRSKHGHWALIARFGEAARDEALRHARGVEDSTGEVVQVLEESYTLDTEITKVRVLLRSESGTGEIQPPESKVDVGSRIFMVGVNSFGFGVIMAVVMAVFLSSLRSSDIPISNGTYTMLLFITFAAMMLTAGLVLFRIYVPVDVILWRAKSPEAQQQSIQALLYGRVAEDSEADEVFGFAGNAEAPPEVISASGFETVDEATQAAAIEAAAAQAAPEADIPLPVPATGMITAESETFAIIDKPADIPAAPAPETAPQESIADSAASILQNVVDKARATLIAFADETVKILTASKPKLEAFDRFGLNLYFSGAAGASADHNGLGQDIKLEMLNSVLIHTGTSALLAKSFCDRLYTSAERPRFRRMIEAGYAAMKAMLTETPDPAVQPISDMIQQWSDPHNRAAEPSTFIFLLTDLVGSTALTSKLGNSGAQRVVRAHNNIVRAAVREFRGVEVKHTGDGFLLTFPDIVAVTRAAIEIQQEAHRYTKENAEAPLVMRIGIHQGEAVYEEGDYYGAAVQVVNGVCGAVEANEIGVTPPIKEKSISGFKFTDLGQKPLKGMNVQRQLFRLEWQPKRVQPKGPIEYRQIGTKPAGAEPAPEAPAAKKPATTPATS